MHKNAGELTSRISVQISLEIFQSNSILGIQWKSLKLSINWCYKKIKDDLFIKK